ncbi:hypothetical protein Agub_g10440 [Astrephomene gubernaculifera]|uniref:Uncharacterized protein n=1 Tax=Astrephomene gubernaculifera TaxID=47775 RepID=A0AAD3DWR7_9CHLO|nr:hypothetical protein Agub_g10440 [Astrephomene gubernaculifera]
MNSVLLVSSCSALCRAQLASVGRLPSTLRAFSAAADAPSAAAAEGSSDSGAVPAAPALDALNASAIDEAVGKLQLNLALKTETLVAHGVGETEALKRQQQLHFSMLLAARRKDIREGKEGAQYAGMLVSEALRKSLAK